jgi:hypothetical protein
MSMSPDELFNTLNTWKTEGRRLRIVLRQSGLTALRAMVTAWETPKDSSSNLTFWFGFTELAEGKLELTVPLSPLLSVKKLDINDPSLLGSGDPSVEFSIMLTWGNLARDQEYCRIDLLR